MSPRVFFPDLLEEFMSACNDTEHWITVQEFREKMSLNTSYAIAISGFLRRLYNNPSGHCRYMVVRIDDVMVDQPYPRITRRYLVRDRAVQREALVVLKEKKSVSRAPPPTT
ncbi:MAG: hypothetical protein LUQ31_01480 [Methanoregula sp.]|nr:hypothetical protein [Methanoregula sp.]